MNQIKNINRNISLRRKRISGCCFSLPEDKESELDIATVSVLFTTVGSLSNDGDQRPATGNEKRQKTIGFYEQNNSCERVSRFEYISLTSTAP